eukprot:COSAG01_NODE_17787_length_1124_cov_1.264390_3_plen_163_part_01
MVTPGTALSCCRRRRRRPNLLLRRLQRHLSNGGTSGHSAVASRPLWLPADDASNYSAQPFALEILGLDLGQSSIGGPTAAPVTSSDAAFIRQSLHRYGLLLFRGQSPLTPERQVEVTEACFGAVEPHPLRSRPGLLGDRVLVRWQAVLTVRAPLPLCCAALR